MRVVALTLLLFQITLNAAEFEKQGSCFQPFPSYDSWVEFVRGKNKGKNIPDSVLHSIIPPKEFEYAKQNLECNFISYESDGYTISGYLILPSKKIDANEKYPVLIYNRGGNARFGATTVAGLFRYMIPMAKKGYIVLASQYRGLNPKAPEVSGNDEFGGEDVNDVIKLFDIVDSLPNTDANNIFMAGASRGAMMNYLVAKKTNRLNAIASLAGPTDILAELKWRPEMERVFKARIPNYEVDKENQLKQRSVIYWVDQLPKNIPILLFHGEKDKRVNVNSSINFASKLDELNWPHKLVLYPEAGHQMREQKEDIINQTNQWFKKYMK